MDHLARLNLLERIRVYLRRNDFVYGYFPQLIMEERASEWWCFLWYCVRSLDTLIDTSSAKVHASSTMDGFLDDLSEGDLKAGISLFLQETAAIMPRSLINGLYRSTQIEKTSFTTSDPPSAISYLNLVDMKAVIPVRICLLLNGMKGDPEVMSRFATALGRAIQLLDDLLDLSEDLEQGKLFITREELQLLGLTPAELPSHLDRVAKLRIKWVMAAIWPAYDALAELAENNFTLAARGWFESAWKLIADGKAEPLQPNIVKNNLFFSHYMGASTLPFDLFPGSELLKYHLFHRPALVFLKRYKVFEVSRAREMYHQMDIDLGPLLQLVIPDAPVTTNWREQAADSRQFVDLSDSFGLTALQQELRGIVSKTAADWYSEVAGRMDRDPTRAILDLAGEAVDMLEAIRFDKSTGREETLVQGSSPRASGFAPIFNLGVDCFSIFVRHQVAFQNDLLAWVERNAGQEEQRTHF